MNKKVIFVTQENLMDIPVIANLEVQAIYDKYADNMDALQWGKVKRTPEKEKKWRESIPKLDKQLTELRKCVSAAEFTNEQMILIEKAITKLLDWQQSHVRKDGESYPIHPVDVAVIGAEYYKIFSFTEVITWLLHDVLEDVETVSQRDILNTFGFDVLYMLRYLTNEDVDPSVLEGLSKAEKAISKIIFYWAGVKSEISVNDVVCKTKAADMSTNAFRLNSPELDDADRYRLANKYVLPMENLYQQLSRNATIKLSQAAAAGNDIDSAGVLMKQAQGMLAMANRYVEELPRVRSYAKQWELHASLHTQAKDIETLR